MDVLGPQVKEEGPVMLICGGVEGMIISPGTVLFSLLVIVKDTVFVLSIVCPNDKLTSLCEGLTSYALALCREHKRAKSTIATIAILNNKLFAQPRVI
jgi:hypothetical protein